MDDASEVPGNSASAHWKQTSEEKMEEQDASNHHLIRIDADADGMSSVAEEVDDEQEELVDIDDGDTDGAIDIPDMMAVRYELSFRLKIELNLLFCVLRMFCDALCRPAEMLTMRRRRRRRRRRMRRAQLTATL